MRNLEFDWEISTICLVSCLTGERNVQKRMKRNRSGSENRSEINNIDVVKCDSSAPSPPAINPSRSVHHHRIDSTRLRPSENPHFEMTASRSL